MEKNISKQKLFVFDLDGTLLNSKSELSEQNFYAIRKARERNNLVAIATGRNYIFAKKVMGKYWQHLDYFIGCNGSIMHKVQNNEYYHISKQISYALVEFVVDEVKKIGGGVQVSTFWNVYADVFINENEKWFSSDVKAKYFTSWQPISKMSSDEWNSIIQVSAHVSEENIRKFKAKLVERFSDYYDFSITSRFNIDMNIKNVSKLVGIKKIVKENNINNNLVYVFGDTQNDIPGLRHYNNTFAMRNGLSETKDVAKYVIGSNDSDAIANVVLKAIREDK